MIVRVEGSRVWSPTIRVGSFISFFNTKNERRRRDGKVDGAEFIAAKLPCARNEVAKDRMRSWTIKFERRLAEKSTIGGSEFWYSR